MNKILLYFILFFSFNAYSQTNTTLRTWTFTSIDSSNNKNIAYVTISINKERYFAADINGKITLQGNTFKEGDTIWISSIGYNTKLCLVNKNFLFPDKIFLIPSVIALDEVKISSKSVKVAVGLQKNFYIASYLPRLNQELALYIPNNKHLKGYIINVEYEVNNELNGIDKPFKVMLYSTSKELTPNKPLINDDIIVDNVKKKHHLDVDLSKYNIEIPDTGFFIVFEILSDEYYSNRPLNVHGWQPFTRVPALGTTGDNKDGLFSLYRINKNSWTHLPDANFLMSATIESL